MKKILLVLFFNCTSWIVNCALAQITCDTSGNVVLYSNYDGGVLNINVDVNIPNLKIGVVSYEMVTINLTGPFVNNITEVRFAGYPTTTHHHCGNSPAVTSIVGASPGTDTLVFMPVSPVSNSNGYYIIICNYSCDTVTNQGGCNTPDQVAAYFQQEFGGLLRFHFTQYGCWSGNYNISDGGNCCISALTAAPAALFSSANHICPGTCTDFINLSTHATAYEWTFPGATPSSSTDINPAGICYNTPGSYSVSLIATGAGGSDTATLNNYMTVYPYPPAQGIMQSGDTLFANAGAVSYQWYYNQNIITGATDYYYVASQSGDYNVVATDANGCEVEAVVFNAVASFEEPGGSSNGAPGQLTVFPNPVEQILSIYSPLLLAYGVGRDAAEISVYNMLGEKVMAVSPGSFGGRHVYAAHVHSLLPGMYWLELSAGEKTSRSKFVKSAIR
jgi:PKD repeat protein